MKSKQHKKLSEIYVLLHDTTCAHIVDATQNLLKNSSGTTFYLMIFKCLSTEEGFERTMLQLDNDMNETVQRCFLEQRDFYKNVMVCIISHYSFWLK